MRQFPGPSSDVQISVFKVTSIIEYRRIATHVMCCVVAQLFLFTALAACLCCWYNR